MQHTLVFGATWHVVASKWWQSWCAYTGFSADAGRSTQPSKGPQPSTIDNSSLLDPAFPADLAVIRKDARENEDYELLPQKAAQLLQSWYGGGPELPRRVEHVGVRKKNTRVDLHPLRFRLIVCDPDTGSEPASSDAVPAPAPVNRSLTLKDDLSTLQEQLHNASEAAMLQEEKVNPEAEVSPRALSTLYPSFWTA